MGSHGAQLGHLAGLACLPNVTIQVVPNIAHVGLLGRFAVAERAATVETAVAGQVFEDADIIAGLLTRVDPCSHGSEAGLRCVGAPAVDGDDLAPVSEDRDSAADSHA